MQQLAAWLVTIAGAWCAGLGLILLMLFRSTILGGREQRELLRGMTEAGTKFDSSQFHTPEARRTFRDLGRTDPRLAAEAIKSIEAYEQLETEPDKLTRVRRYARILVYAAYLVPTLVLFGGIAVGGGVLWLRSL